MRAGTEGQAGIQQDIDRIRIRGFRPARHDPEPVAELHGFEMAHPFPLPVPVFQDFKVDGLNRRITVGLPEADHAGVLPQRRFTRSRFQHGLIGPVRKGDGQGIQCLQRFHDGFRAIAGGLDGNLQPAQSFSRSLISFSR